MHVAHGEVQDAHWLFEIFEKNPDPQSATQNPFLRKRFPEHEMQLLLAELVQLSQE